MASGKIYDDPVTGPVILVKSPACRRISIRVHPADGVKVVIPGSLSYDEGLRFFLLKRDWVVSTIARQRERAEKARRDGKTLPLLCNGTAVKTLMSEIVFVRRDEGAAARHGLRKGGGGEVPVSVAVTPVEDVRQTGRTWLSLERPLFRKEVVYPGSLPEEGSPGLDSLLRQVLVDILRKEARLVLPQKVAFFADRFGFPYGKVAVKHNSSNWGSCSARGNINLNLNLVRLPEALCDYVVLHELCHLKYRDHGPHFHALLEKMCTDNVMRLAGTGDPYMEALVRKVNTSRAGMPVSRTLEREMKGYGLI